ncbi:MAG: hypothetical protein Ct9H300mP11_30350 [Chloroflexota bacterium]|nr:MAG: hypothetical protein Ct9H300mP11_30350 [Chloroflexota bacterium]
MAIDQQTRRRMSNVGLTALDEPGVPGIYPLRPHERAGDVYLLNLDGEEVHHWNMPDPPGLYGYLLPNGNFFYGGKLRDDMWDGFNLGSDSKGE